MFSKNYFALLNSITFYEILWANKNKNETVERTISS